VSSPNLPRDSDAAHLYCTIKLLLRRYWNSKRATLARINPNRDPTRPPPRLPPDRQIRARGLTLSAVSPRRVCCYFAPQLCVAGQQRERANAHRGSSSKWKGEPPLIVSPLSSYPLFRVFFLASVHLPLRPLCHVTECLYYPARKFTVTCHGRTDLQSLIDRQRTKRQREKAKERERERERERKRERQTERFIEQAQTLHRRKNPARRASSTLIVFFRRAIVRSNDTALVNECSNV